MQRAQLLADAALVLRDAGIPVWTAGVPESAGVLGVLSENQDLIGPDGVAVEATLSTLDLAPGSLGALSAASRLSARPDGPNGAVVSFRVLTPPKPRPPDGTMHRVAVARVGAFVAGGAP